MVVTQPTRPANYFHLLRRQMLRNYRKPLVVITPKIGLKHAAYTSKLEDFSENKFTPIIIDNYASSLSKTKSVIFCSGQIFIEINKSIEARLKETNIKPEITVIRIEEVAPFPEQQIMNYLGKDNTLNKSANVKKP
jgi:2-oxoglutarate dehydrogenase complex dehydrogenase (E1) component-like enzyme